AGPVPGVLGGSVNLTDLSRPAGVTLIPPVAVSAGHSLARNAGFRGLAPEVISLRLFLSSTTSAGFPLPPAGTGMAFPDGPVLKTPIADLSLVGGTGSTTIDLGGHFSDPNFTDTLVRLNTSMGPINVELFDAQAPQTVANFLKYVTAHKYDNSIFHRLAKNPDGSLFVLQGGGFTFQAGPPAALPAIPVDPAVPSEFDATRSNVLGTVAMALPSNADGSTNINGGTDQFFFN